MDLEQKGFVVVEDLVRFMNMNVGVMYRKRDLVMMWGRVVGDGNKDDGRRSATLKEGNRATSGVDFQSLLDVFCKHEEA